LFRVELIGFESLGVRSMATAIYSDEATLIIDPGASLAPYRYSLPPHEIEWKKLHEVIDRICDVLRDADAFIVSHYHYDHHDPGKFIDPELYKGKVALIKDPKNNINISQRIRSSRFIKIIKDRVRSFKIIDNSTYVLGDLKLKFSKPVPHGVDERLGYVVMVAVIHEDMKLLFTSDIEGPVNEYEVDFITSSNPDIVIIDGPPTYLLNHGNITLAALEKSIKLNARIIDAIENLKYLIIDHHLLRDLDYAKIYDEILDKSLTRRLRPITAAEFMGLKPNLLEARRRELYGIK